ncbi:hypothetical protein BGZ83_011901 [Gryganskiella cystojenkinii]|nr:hypothetical protein BGZ83_011901 [Gryganskiella cystojenkinii]
MRIYKDPFANQTPFNSSNSLNTLVRDRASVTNLPSIVSKVNQQQQQKHVNPVALPSSSPTVIATTTFATTSAKPQLTDQDQDNEAHHIITGMVAIWGNATTTTKEPSNTQALTVDIPQPSQTLDRSPSNEDSAPSSPNQLRGIVIESLRAPISRPIDTDTIDNNGRQLQEMSEARLSSAYLLDRQTRLSQRSRHQKSRPKLPSQDSTTTSLLSPALSYSTSHSTGVPSCRTGSSTASHTTVSTSTTPSSSLSRSSHGHSPRSPAASSAASTLCHSASEEPEAFTSAAAASSARKPKCTRSYARWARGVASELGQSRCDIPKIEFSPTIPPTMAKDWDSGEPRRPTLKELSKRSTRYYSKNAPPSFGQGGDGNKGNSIMVVSGKVVCGGKKKGPKKPDAKAFFSNERTFMHWIKFGLLLGTMALTLVSFGKDVGMQVGLFLVLVAMSTFVYATTTFHLRHRWMEQMRVDVRFYDRIGPSILFACLFLAFATNVILTMYQLMNGIEDDSDLNFYHHSDGPLDV